MGAPANMWWVGVAAVLSLAVVARGVYHYKYNPFRYRFTH